MTDQRAEARGRVEALWIKRERGAPMDPVAEAAAVARRGLVGNAEQGGPRQITLIEREMWDAYAADRDVEPAMRRANVMVSGVVLREAEGKVIRLGDVRVELHGETRPCPKMDAASPGLRDTLARDGGGGAHGTVLDDGVIRVGDPVSWTSV